MVTKTYEGVKTISANNAEDFDRELNHALQGLAAQGISYTMQLAPQLGYTAFIVYKKDQHIPETIEDEFKLGGERHFCIECPFYVRPTDGRVKHTRCPITPGLHRKDSECCNEFYKKLFNGEIDLVEVG